MINELSDWTDDIEGFLENIRKNCITQSQNHKNKYFSLCKTIKFFKIPIIIISAFNSVISVGLLPYVSQNILSSVTCGLSLGVSLIASIEIYLQIDKSKNDELESSKEYYLLSIDIFKNLSLYKSNRESPSKEYLIESYNKYCKLIENSNLLMNSLDDKLLPLNLNTKLINDF